MPWAAAAAGLAGAAVPAIFGGKDAKPPNAFKMGAAQSQIDNPNRNTYFGGERTVRDDMGTPKSFADDVYTNTAVMSPEMQALADELLSRAGASRGSYQSGGMPDALGDIYSRSLTSYGGGRGAEGDLSARPTRAIAERPEFGFDRGGEAAVAAENALSPNLPSGSTNSEALAWALENTPISGGDADFLRDMWAESEGMGARGGQGTFMQSPEYDVNVHQPGLAPENKAIVNRFRNYLDVPTDSTGTPMEPTGELYDSQALSRLLQSLGGYANA